MVSWCVWLREQRKCVSFGVFVLDPLKLLKNVTYLAFSEYVACVYATTG